VSAARCSVAPVHRFEHNAATDIRRGMHEYADRASTVRTAQHSITLLPRVREFLEAFLEDLSRAQKRVFVEIYIFSGDLFGTLVRDALVAASRRGVPVYVLYDRLGCEETDPLFFEELRASGPFVECYRPFEVAATDAAPFPRDHSRNFVIDDAAYTGGIAFSKPWLPRYRGGDGWHDVCVRVEGPVVEDFAHLFQERWGEAEGGTPRDFCTGDRYPDLELVSDTPSYDSKVFDRHLDRFRVAEKRIHIVNSYFYPSRVMSQALFEAVARGVDVTVVTCGESDLGLVKNATRSAEKSWIEQGLAIHEYCDGTLHAKYALVDDDWCTIGTFNANPTSVAMANEVNLFVFDRAFVARVDALFRLDLARSKEMTVEELDARGTAHRIRDFGALQALKALDFIAGPTPGRGSST
jgi:cardiolipin synthase